MKITCKILVACAIIISTLSLSTYTHSFPIILESEMGDMDLEDVDIEYQLEIVMPTDPTDIVNQTVNNLKNTFAYLGLDIGNDRENPITFTIDNTTDVANQRLSPVTQAVVSICKALFPVSLIAIIILLIVSRQEKKVARYISIAITICTATFIVILVGEGYINGIVVAISNLLGL